MLADLIAIASLSANIAAATTAATGARLGPSFPVAGIALGISTTGRSCPSAAAATPAATLVG